MNEDSFQFGWPESSAAMLSRRTFLERTAVGFGSLALASMLADETSADTPSANPLAAKPSHIPAPAKRIIFLLMSGGPSQVDTWDPKPVLDRHDGRPIPVGNLTTERETGVALASPFRFQQYGDSERADSVEAAMGDAALHAAQHVTKPSYVS